MSEPTSSSADSLNGQFRKGPNKLVLAAIGLAVIAAAVLGAVWFFNTPAEAGREFVFATDVEPETGLDPAQDSNVAQALISRAYLDSLTYQEKDGSIGKWLATDWQISGDETVYTFKLRQDVSFSDGTKFNAAAVKANVEYWVDPNTGFADANEAFGHFRSVEALDDYTVKIDIGKPYADFLSFLAHPFAGIQSPAGIKRGREVNAQQGPIGTGPFVVQEWVKKSHVTLVRNDGYNSAPASSEHKGPAQVEKITYRFISDPIARFGALKNGEVHAIQTVPPENYQDVVSSQNLTLIDGVRAGIPVQLDLNTTKKPFDDVLVRKAFRHAVDVPSALSSIFRGSYKYFGGSLSPSTVFYDAAFEDAYPFDISKANQLLDQAGWTARDADGYRVKDGARLRVYAVIGYTPSPQEYSLYDQIAGTAKQAGFEFAYEKLDNDQAREIRSGWNYDLRKYYWGGPASAAVLFYLYHSDNIKTHYNGAGYSSPALDALIDQAAIVANPDERRKLYSQAQKIISDEALAAPLFLEPLQYVYRSDIIEGLVAEPRTNQASFLGVRLLR